MTCAHSVTELLSINGKNLDGAIRVCAACGEVITTEKVMTTWTQYRHPAGSADLLVAIDHEDGRSIYRVNGELDGLEFNLVIGPAVDEDEILQVAVDVANHPGGGSTMHVAADPTVKALLELVATAPRKLPIERAEMEIRAAFIALYGCEPGIDWTAQQARKLLHKAAA